MKRPAWAPPVPRGAALRGAIGHPLALIAIVLLGFALPGLLLAAPNRSADQRIAVMATPVATGILAIDGDTIEHLVLPGPGQQANFVVGERGLYRSGDDGATWRMVGPLPPAPRIAIAADESLLLAGSLSPCGRAPSLDLPLYRSLDGGASWAIVAGVSGLLPLAVWHEPGIAAGATCAGLKISHDGAITWHRTAVLPPDLEITASVPVLGSPPLPTLLAIGSSEGGTSVLSRITLAESGEAITSEPLHTFWGSGAVGGRGEQIVLGTAEGVLVSRDDGRSWELSRQGLEKVTLSVDPTRGPIPDAELERGFGILAVAFDPGDAERFSVGTVSGVFCTSDGGKSWEKVAGTGGVVTALAVTPRGTMLAQTDDGVVIYAAPARGECARLSGTPAASEASAIRVMTAA